MEIKKFNIRVYGLILYQKQILLTDEYRLNRTMTKFPGGGLEFGEGTIDCLIREFREELSAEITNIRHFYTTDYFQPTFLLPEPQQLISIYYLADFVAVENLKISNKAFDFSEHTEGAQSFRWVDLSSLEAEDLSFPIDQRVLKMIKQQL